MYGGTVVASTLARPYASDYENLPDVSCAKQFAAVCDPRTLRVAAIDNSRDLAVPVAGGFVSGSMARVVVHDKNYNIICARILRGGLYFLFTDQPVESPAGVATGIVAETFAPPIAVVTEVGKYAFGRALSCDDDGLRHDASLAGNYGAPIFDNCGKLLALQTTHVAGSYNVGARISLPTTAADCRLFIRGTAAASCAYMACSIGLNAAIYRVDSPGIGSLITAAKHCAHGGRAFLIEIIDMEGQFDQNKLPDLGQYRETRRLATQSLKLILLRSTNIRKEVYAALSFMSVGNIALVDELTADVLRGFLLQINSQI